jgi:2-C-methyl-D-erythritol 4-phosphate cytidylyltransferase
VRDIILVVNAGNSRSIISKIRQYRITKIRRIVEGGRRRQDSVYNALRVMDNRTDLVLIHDGVRPFIDKETVSSVIKEAQDSGAAVMGVPVKATIKSVARSPVQPFARSLFVKQTLNRENLWEIQTPQVFRKDLILKAYKRFGRGEVTDDASLVEKSGAKVKIVKGSYANIKITTPEDLILAKAMAKKGLKRL